MYGSALIDEFIGSSLSVNITAGIFISNAMVYSYSCLKHCSTFSDSLRLNNTALFIALQSKTDKVYNLEEHEVMLCVASQKTKSLHFRTNVLDPAKDHVT